MRVLVIDAPVDPTIVTVQPEQGDGSLLDNAATYRVRSPEVGTLLRSAYLRHSPLDITVIEGACMGYVVSATEPSEQFVQDLPNRPE